MAEYRPAVFGRAPGGRATGLGGRARGVQAAVATAWVLAGCAGGQQVGVAQHAGLSCVDDSQECIGHRQSALRQIMADHQRAWIREQPTPHAYATGVRLFAFKSKKKELTCDELAIGRREADAAPGVLRGPGGKTLTPAQVSRGVMLAGDVGRELGNEIARRCRKA